MNESSKNQRPRVSTLFYTFAEDEPFVLRSGEALGPVTLAYEMYGELNEKKDNAILLFHALSGSQHAAGYNAAVEGIGDRWTDDCKVGWWDDFIGPRKALNTDYFCVICVNYLGGCYGSTGPSSINPKTGKPYGSAFPSLHLIDLVRSQSRLLDHLGIDTLHATLGASLGGMMALLFAARYAERTKIVIPMVTGIEITMLNRLHNFEQLSAIEQSPQFSGGDYYDGEAPDQGLALARSIAHKTYVSLHFMEDRARSEITQDGEGFSHYTFTHPVESYLQHQGSKFVKRFDANTYVRIIEAWQRFDFARECEAESIHEAFSRCQHQRYMVFSVDSDVAFYPEEQSHLVRALKKAEVPCRHITVHSEKGHDAFLLEPELFTPQLVYSLETSW